MAPVAEAIQRRLWPKPISRVRVCEVLAISGGEQRCNSIRVGRPSGNGSGPRLARRRRKRRG